MGKEGKGKERERDGAVGETRKGRHVYQIDGVTRERRIIMMEPDKKVN